MGDRIVGSKKSKMIRKISFFIIIIFILVVVLFPFVWMLLASFKKNADILNVDKMFDFIPTLKNYISVFIDYSFLKPIFNSFLISFAATVIALFLGLPAAYAIGRARMHLFSGIILMIRIVPAISFLVPWYLIFTKLKLTGTYTSLIVCHLIVSLPMIIWIMMPYFESIPKELEEAAKIDGASNFGTFMKIMIPLSTPGVLTSGILTFIFSWNNFMFALILCSSKTTTLPIAIYQFISYSNVDWGGIMAASVVITLPIILISFFLQRHIITGLTAGAVKG
ncbi:carbohydrate ABC transporter permease [Muricomes intestini]|jgi:multiple sugar transport system permease protein|uniref:Carbohydrate ABC transporter membrane protein 2 (CUT1 family) n=1 Tax=Muricomes intestini TaxID=1796634 RepID=A0A4R3K028_9FIRM|nr:carbohydrate ABC transporter permease [Muricomes intestini]TCS75069.1 carbohydrate ABC transporter membrane protein 2 (CUT1 family) [Muricomes intestini]HAX53604.1 sugar ABC transporter permease [Lachnospiraceae bacterium]